MGGDYQAGAAGVAGSYGPDGTTCLWNNYTMTYANCTNSTNTTTRNTKTPKAGNAYSDAGQQVSASLIVSLMASAALFLTV